MRNLTISLIDSDEKIMKDLHSALATEVTNLMFKVRAKIGFEIAARAYYWLLDSPEIQSLESSAVGSLAAQFGIPLGSQLAVQQKIIEAIVKSIKVDIYKATNTLDGIILDISSQPMDFRNLLNMKEADIDIGHRKLNWLRWLLTEGTSIIVVGYRYSPEAGIGRSKGGIMIEKGNWRVPPEFAGTEENNFITRAFSNREIEISRIVEGAL